MTCSEARQYIFAFLDNELDSALSLEVQQHIEHCAVCARECEIENVVRRQLAVKLQQTDAVPEFDESAFLRMLRSEPGVPLHTRRTTRRYWKLGTAGAIAAALLFAVTLFVTSRAKTGAHHVPLVDALVDCFDHFQSQGKPLEIVSDDASIVSKWLRDQTALAVHVPIVDPARGSLIGGRKCEVNGTPGTFTAYRLGDELASVVVLGVPDDALARMKRIDRNGHTHWVDHCRGHTVLACRRGDLIYAVISRLPEELLSPLMPPTEG